MLFASKLVIIVNKDLEIGIAMNAVAHASLAIGAVLGKETIFLQDYKDASNNNWPISGMPYIILRGKSGEIRKAISEAKQAQIMQIAFVETMTGGTYIEQMEQTLQIAEDQHKYYAGVLFGSHELVNKITKRFSLYK